MGKIDEIVEEMSEYICDELCRYSTECGLDQEDLEKACQGCKIGRFLNGILEERRCAASRRKPQEALWKSSLMQRFMIVS